MNLTQRSLHEMKGALRGFRQYEIERPLRETERWSRHAQTFDPRQSVMRITRDWRRVITTYPPLADIARKTTLHKKLTPGYAAGLRGEEYPQFLRSVRETVLMMEHYLDLKIQRSKAQKAGKVSMQATRQIMSDLQGIVRSASGGLTSKISQRGKNRFYVVIPRHHDKEGVARVTRAVAEAIEREASNGDIAGVRRANTRIRVESMRKLGGYLGEYYGVVEIAFSLISVRSSSAQKADDMRNYISTLVRAHFGSYVSTANVYPAGPNRYEVALEREYDKGEAWEISRKLERFLNLYFGDKATIRVIVEGGAPANWRPVATITFRSQQRA